VQSIRAVSLAAQILRCFGRPLLIAACWLTAVAIGTGCFAYSGARSINDELIGFACSFAVAAPIATLIPLILGGKKSWAANASLAIASATLVVVGATYLLLWATPSLVRNQMGYWEFRRLQHFVVYTATMTASLCAPLGAIVGGVIGTIAGLLVVLRRRAPKLAAGLAVGVLLACASGPVQSFAFGLATDLVLKRRLEGGKWAVSSISEKELGSALGATMGAVFGAVIGVSVMRFQRESIVNAGDCPSVTSQSSEPGPASKP
jgi:hypothetical protein